jgi:hypothetical protein
MTEDAMDAEEGPTCEIVNLGIPIRMRIDQTEEPDTTDFYVAEIRVERGAMRANSELFATLAGLFPWAEIVVMPQGWAASDGFD